jgi:hypothetical protein
MPIIGLLCLLSFNGMTLSSLSTDKIASITTLIINRFINITVTMIIGMQAHSLF